MAEAQSLTLPVVALARRNDDFRKIIWTGKKTRLVLMAIPEGGEIGGKVHKGHDKLRYFVGDSGTAKIDETTSSVADGDVRIVSSGVFHNVRNTGSGVLKLFTTYSPPEHEPGTEHATKADADGSVDEG